MAPFTVQPSLTAHSPTALSASSGSWLALLGQLIEGLFLPAPLSAPTHRRQAPGAFDRVSLQALDTPTYLRQGIRIPELE